jgi:hypothetical protein
MTGLSQLLPAAASEMIVLLLLLSATMTKVSSERANEKMEYIVVVKHESRNSLMNHFSLFSDDKVRRKAHRIFPNLAQYNVHMYTTFDVDLVEFLRQHDSVEYVELSSEYRVASSEPLMHDDVDYIIPEFTLSVVAKDFWPMCTHNPEFFEELRILSEQEQLKSNEVFSKISCQNYITYCLFKEIFIFDTGINASRGLLSEAVVARYSSEFEALPENADLDSNGHGTAVAGSFDCVSI